MTKRVLILGANGMLGGGLVRWFSSQSDIAVSATTRSGAAPVQMAGSVENVGWHALDVDAANEDSLSALCSGHDLVINAIGKIKQKIHDGDLSDWDSTVRANALFPVLLAKTMERTGGYAVQIATDCVYSGIKGSYIETDMHDPQDIYGKSKSLGEVATARSIYLRCSMVGPELSSSFSLLSWFLARPQGAKISGYTNHLWNGLTSLHFAKICKGLIDHTPDLSCVSHLLPADSVSKYELLALFAKYFGREDIEISPVETSIPIDRTLLTLYPEVNADLWARAGYGRPPTVEDMIKELAEYEQCSLREMVSCPSSVCRNR